MNDNSNEKPDRYDANLKTYMDLYRGQMEQFRSTQQVEWRVNLSIWTMLVLVSYGAAAKGLRVPCIWATSGLLLLLLVHAFWTNLIHRSMDIDKVLFAEFRLAALQMMGHEVPKKNDANKEESTRETMPIVKSRSVSMIPFNGDQGWNHWRWILLHLLVSFTLAVIAWYTVTQPPIDSNESDRSVTVLVD